MKIELSTGHQQDFYDRLVRKELPKFLTTDIHSRPHAFVHFCLALTAYVQRNPNQRDWLIQKPLRLIRSQMKMATSGQIKAYASAVAEICKDRETRIQAAITPFVVDPDDQQGATSLMLKISEVLMTPNFAQDPNLPTVDLLLTIISTQKDSRTWNLFMRALQLGNTSARLAFQNMFEFWAANLEIPKFKSLDAMGTPMTLSNEECVPLTFAVPADCAHTANSLFDEWRKKHIMPLDAFRELTDTFWENRHAYQNRAHAMWQEVTQNASCDLSFKGDDTAEVTIGPLREQGLRYIQMVPQNSRPDTLAVFWYQTPVSKQLYYIERLINGPDLRLGESPEKGGMIAKVTSLNLFLAISSIWTVCMGHFHKAKTKTSTCAAEDSRSEPAYARPHFRRIDHLGQKPSPEALKRCDEHYQGQRMPPAGKTFVKQYEIPQMTRRAGLDSIVVVCRIRDESLRISA